MPTFTMEFSFDLSPLKGALIGQSPHEQFISTIELSDAVGICRIEKGPKSPSMPMSGRFIFTSAVIAVSRSLSESDREALLKDHSADIETHNRKQQIRADFQVAALECLNRIIRFFRETLFAPLATEVEYSDLSRQAEAFFFPRCFDGDVECNPLAGLSIPFVWVHGSPHLLDKGIGVMPFSPEKVVDLSVDPAPRAPNVIAMYRADAQDAAIGGNLERSVLSMAIATECLVKSSLFAAGTHPSGAVYDRTRSFVENLSCATAARFGLSYKDSRPIQFRDIDYLFRARNKVAHEGVAYFKDVKGARHVVELSHLRAWWAASSDLESWITTA